MLATGTWDREGAVAELGTLALGSLAGLLGEDHALSPIGGVTLHGGSLARARGETFVLATLADGQHVLLDVHDPGSAPLLQGPIWSVGLASDAGLRAYATDAAVLHEYLGAVALSRRPRALGQVPRLGIGVRMTSACWPGIFAAMDEGGFAANPIQNSVRELNFLSDLLEGRPADRNYASGFGMIEAGYTGSTFEGLWTWGVLAALKHPTPLALGADADHVQVKRGPEGMGRAKRYIDSCRYHSFFTLDMADILDYAAVGEPSSAVARDRALSIVGSEHLRREVHACHDQQALGGEALPEALVDRMICKYWAALEALEEVVSYLRELRQGEAFDLEFTIDEHPPEIRAFDCLTSDEECFFVVNEIARRSLPVTHLAPNTGTEKGFDYRGADGLDGFERRVASLASISADRGILIDIHSADDLTAPARAAIRRATGGRLHYKVSPMLQLIFAGVLEDVHPGLFRDWWHDAVAYAREEASASPFARWCLDELDAKSSTEPSHKDAVFHHYGFRYVGRRDPDGQFLDRQRFYSLSPEFHRVYDQRLRTYVLELASDLFA